MKKKKKDSPPIQSFLTINHWNTFRALFKPQPLLREANGHRECDVPEPSKGNLDRVKNELTSPLWFEQS